MKHSEERGTEVEKKQTVVVVARDQTVRNYLKRLVAQAGGVVIGEKRRFEPALKLIREKQPALLVTDIALNDQGCYSGLDLAVMARIPVVLTRTSLLWWDGMGYIAQSSGRIHPCDLADHRRIAGAISDCLA